MNKWDYLAGLTDGEGTIGGYYHKKNKTYQFAYQVYNTDYKLMLWLKNNFSGHISNSGRKIINPKHKLAYSWKPHRRNTIFILNRLKSRLIIKRKQAILVLKFLNSNQHPFPIKGKRSILPASVVAFRKKLITKLKTLNKRGNR